MSSKNLDPVIEDYQGRVAQGEQRNKGIEDLHSDGLSIIDAIKTVRVLYKLGLKEAHLVIACHSAWQSTVKNAEPLHGEIEKALEIFTHLGLCKDPTL
jgi:ribosomal protein L7/L12